MVLHLEKSSYLDTVILRLIISLNVNENDSKT